MCHQNEVRTFFVSAFFGIFAIISVPLCRIFRRRKQQLVLHRLAEACANYRLRTLADLEWTVIVSWCLFHCLSSRSDYCAKLGIVPACELIILVYKSYAVELIVKLMVIYKYDFSHFTHLLL